MRYLNVFYGVIVALILFLLVSGIGSSINTCSLETIIFITLFIIFGAVVTCTFYIIEAIEKLRQDLNRDKDLK